MKSTATGPDLFKDIDVQLGDTYLKLRSLSSGHAPFASSFSKLSINSDCHRFRWLLLRLGAWSSIPQNIGFVIGDIYLHAKALKVVDQAPIVAGLRNLIQPEGHPRPRGWARLHL